MNVILYDYKLYFIMQQGRNALHIACQCGANETVLYLLNNKAITDIGIGNIQIFLFDDKTNSEMNINANNVENLCKIDEDGNLIQTGFIPFYRPAKKNTEQK